MYRKFKGLRLGVLCNQASVDRKLRHAAELLIHGKVGLKISCLFGPQHGIRGEKQDNMVESTDSMDPRTGLKVYSLYSHAREPTAEMVAGIDAFLIDLQDIGTRIYTFIYTMANCMRAARRLGKRVIVLDRPNPIGGTQLEGNVLAREFTSFVGQYPIAVRHGMTIGELALMFNDAFGIQCELDTIKLVGWKREHSADHWGRDWVPPSPNIPHFLTALVFPGCVLFEGTNVSEGRGTARPFEWIGAPYIDPDKLAREMNQLRLPGVYFRAIYFQPTHQKWKDEVCGGVHIHVLDPLRLRPFQTGLYLLSKIMSMYPKAFQWRSPPYEYEYQRLPIDLIAGTSSLRETLEQGKPISGFEEAAHIQLKEFRRLRSQYLMYV